MLSPVKRGLLLPECLFCMNNVWTDTRSVFLSCSQARYYALIRVCCLLWELHQGARLPSKILKQLLRIFAHRSPLGWGGWVEDTKCSFATCNMYVQSETKSLRIEHKHTAAAMSRKFPESSPYQLLAKRFFFFLMCLSFLQFCFHTFSVRFWNSQRSFLTYYFMSTCVSCSSSMFNGQTGPVCSFPLNHRSTYLYWLGTQRGVAGYKYAAK